MTEQQDTSAVLPAEGFVRLPLILSLIPVSKSTWWSGCKSGRFPAPRQTWAAHDRMEGVRHSSTDRSRKDGHKHARRINLQLN